MWNREFQSQYFSQFKVKEVGGKTRKDDVSNLLTGNLFNMNRIEMFVLGNGNI